MYSYMFFVLNYCVQSPVDLQPFVVKCILLHWCVIGHFNIECCHNVLLRLGLWFSLKYHIQIASDFSPYMTNTSTGHINFV